MTENCSPYPDAHGVDSVSTLFPRRLGDSKQLEATVQDATWWRRFNSEAFDVEFTRLLACEEAGGKVLEGCECETPEEACSRQVEVNVGA